MSFTDSRDASSHAVASFLVPDSDGKKLSGCNLLLGNSDLSYLHCTKNEVFH